MVTLIHKQPRPSATLTRTWVHIDTAVTSLHDVQILQQVYIMIIEADTPPLLSFPVERRKRLNFRRCTR